MSFTNGRRRGSGNSSWAIGLAFLVAVIAIAGLAGRLSADGREELMQKDSGKCDTDCKAHRAAVIQRMKALRQEIDGDYHAMVHFGDKAGYVPPVRSIKAQVMDGTLLGGGKGERDAPPPAFDPNAGTSHHSSQGLSMSSILPRVESVSQVAHEMMHSTSSKAKHEAAVSKHAAAVRVHKRSVAKAAAAVHNHVSSSKAAATTQPVVDIFDPSLGDSVKVHRSHSAGSSDDGSSQTKGKAEWEKDFSFMKTAKRHGHVSDIHSSDDDKIPASVERHIRSKKTTEPAVVRAAMQKALSFATTAMHKSKTEEAGDKLLGLHTNGGAHHAKKGGSDPLDTKFLNSWFGA